MYTLEKHTNYIYQYHNFVPDEHCDRIVNLVESSKSYKTQDISLKRNRSRNNDCLSVTSRRDEPEMAEADALIHHFYAQVHSLYLRQNKLLNFYGNPEGKYLNNLRSSYIYRWYNPGEYYDWHTDYALEKWFVVSYLLYLNDEFEGGDTLFLNDRLRVKARKGSIVCFPCDLQTVHKGAIIKSGTKKVIWSCFEKY